MEQYTTLRMVLMPLMLPVFIRLQLTLQLLMDVKQRTPKVLRYYRQQRPTSFGKAPVRIQTHNLPILQQEEQPTGSGTLIDRKSTRLNSSHVRISYAVFC